MNDFTRILYTKIQIQYTTTQIYTLGSLAMVVLGTRWVVSASYIPRFQKWTNNNPPLSIALKLKQEPPKLCKPCWYPMLKVLLLHFINFDFYQREKVSTIIKLNENELVLIIPTGTKLCSINNINHTII